MSKHHSSQVVSASFSSQGPNDFNQLSRFVGQVIDGGKKVGGEMIASARNGFGNLFKKVTSGISSVRTAVVQKAQAFSQDFSAINEKVMTYGGTVGSALDAAIPKAIIDAKIVSANALEGALEVTATVTNSISKGVSFLKAEVLPEVVSQVQELYSLAKDVIKDDLNPVVIKARNEFRVRSAFALGGAEHIVKSGVDLFKEQVFPTLTSQMKGLLALGSNVFKNDVVPVVQTMREKATFLTADLIANAPLAYENLTAEAGKALSFIKGKAHKGIVAVNEFANSTILPAMDKGVDFITGKAKKALKIGDTLSDKMVTPAEGLFEKKILPIADQGVDAILAAAGRGAQWLNTKSDIFMTASEKFFSTKVLPFTQEKGKILMSKVVRNAPFTGMIRGTEYQQSDSPRRPAFYSDPDGKVDIKEPGPALSSLRRSSPEMIMKNVHFFSFPMKSKNSQGVEKEILFYKPDFEKVAISHYNTRTFFRECEYALNVFLTSSQFQHYKDADFSTLGGGSFRSDDRMLSPPRIKDLCDTLKLHNTTSQVVLREEHVDLLELLGFLSVREGLRLKKLLRLPIDHTKNFIPAESMAA